MARYRGNVSQSILDWYGGQASSAQQWFSQVAPNYWAFTLQNNATDGTRLWVYDAETLSGAAFPAGTGNPFGNPSASPGQPTSTIGNPATFALVNQVPTTLNGVSSIAVNSPGSIVAGNLLLLYLSSANIAANTVIPPDSTWTLLAARDGTASYGMITVWAKIAGASEPGTYTFTLSGSPSVAIDADLFQFSGNANPGFVDQGQVAASIISSTSVIAPAIATTQPGDLIFCVWSAPFNAGNFGLPLGFTMNPNYAGYTNRWRAGWFITQSVGTVGPFVNSPLTAEPWSAVTVSLKAAAAGAAPAQTVSPPIQTVSPLKPGLFTMNFSAGNLGLAGITRWIPPGTHFVWRRESPIAVIDPNTSFNLAGIAPENAAFGSLTWLAIK